MKLHWLMYLIVGVFVMGFSFFIRSKSDNAQQFMLFIWAGGIFILIAIYKLGREWLQNKPAKVKKSAKAEPEMQETNLNVKYCTACGAAMRHFDRFCYKCGNSLMSHTGHKARK
ncbi:hypothetical protein J4401_04680 [Candidatus Woesearchaeota archaeon]|nr:hypothetical protein [Candidatus Woesearchaeota archaeon]